MDEATKKLTIDSLYCGVVLPNGTLCRDEGFTLISYDGDDGDGFALCLCESHATGALIQGRDYIVQETTAKESKRYYGIQFDPVPTEPESQSDFDPDSHLPLQPTLPGFG